MQPSASSITFTFAIIGNKKLLWLNALLFIKSALLNP